MKKQLIAALAAGTALVAVPTPASAAGWQPTSGGTTVEVVNPCTGETTDLTLTWDASHVVATRSGAVWSDLRGTYTGTDGSSGTVRVGGGTAPTREGYTDWFRRQAVGDFDGRQQRMTFLFRIAVGDTIDVRVQRDTGSCSGG